LAYLDTSIAAQFEENKAGDRVARSPDGAQQQKSPGSRRGFDA
jgi:hypothetical protein